MTKGNQETESVLWFVSGAMIGAGIALLFAPQSGRQTRRDIVRMGRTARSKAEEMRLQMRHSLIELADDISAQVQQRIDRGMEWTEKAAEKVQGAVEAGKRTVRQELDKILPS
jgi:gas vesicle protein